MSQAEHTFEAESRMIAESFRAQERRVDAYVDRLKVATAMGSQVPQRREKRAVAKVAGVMLDKVNPKDGSPRAALLLADKKLVGALVKASVAKEAADLGAPIGVFSKGQRDFSDAIALYLLAHARLSGKTLQGEAAHVDAFRRVLHGSSDGSQLRAVVEKYAPIAGAAAAARIKPNTVRRLNRTTAAGKVAGAFGERKLVGKRGSVTDVAGAAVIAAGAAITVFGGAYNTDRIIRNARKLFGPAKAEW